MDRRCEFDALNANGKPGNEGNSSRAFWEQDNLIKWKDTLNLPLDYLQDIGNLIEAAKSGDYITDNFITVARRVFNKYRELFRSYHMPAALQESLKIYQILNFLKILMFLIFSIQHLHSFYSGSKNFSVPHILLD